MPRLWLHLARGGLSLLAFCVFGTVAVSRTLGGGAVIQYGLAAPDDRVIYIALDVTRSLRLTRNEPLPARLFFATDTAADGRQAVSVQSIGNIDLYLTENDGTQRQITHFTDFPPIGGERDSRSANLYPSWSPDNAWIAFISSTVNGRLDLYAVRPDGSGLHHLGDRIRVASPYAPRWVTFDADVRAAWLIISGADLLFLIRLLKGYNRSGSYTG
jgi:hypothetical protein